MKTKLTIIALLCFSINTFGQMYSYLSSFQTADAETTIAGLTLIHRSRVNHKDISDLGTQLIMIPGNPNGHQMKQDIYRYRTLEGTPFEKDSVTYLPIHLYYDSETSDPRDDIHLLSVPFRVDKDFMRKELSYYEGVVKLISFDKRD